MEQPVAKAGATFQLYTRSDDVDSCLKVNNAVRDSPPHLDRIVPRHDLGDDTDRLMASELDMDISQPARTVIEGNKRTAIFCGSLCSMAKIPTSIVATQTTAATSGLTLSSDLVGPS
jgi:hypothetical protein